MALSPGTPLALAESIDPTRARVVGREVAGGAARELSVLLGTVYPPLLPRHDWQRDAVDRIAREGWRVERQRSDVLARLLTAAGDSSDGDRVASNLRRAVWAEKARIALREVLTPDLGGAGVEVTAHELSDLADAAFEVALAEAESFVSRRHGDPLKKDGGRSSMVVLGMGKLGGFELNAGSDVDVVFLSDTDEGAEGVDLHDYWSRVVRRAVATLDTPTEDGMVWRVDCGSDPKARRVRW